MTQWTKINLILHSNPTMSCDLRLCFLLYWFLYKLQKTCLVSVFRLDQWCIHHISIPWTQHSALSSNMASCGFYLRHPNEYLFLIQKTENYNASSTKLSVYVSQHHYYFLLLLLYTTTIYCESWSKFQDLDWIVKVLNVCVLPNKDLDNIRIYSNNWKK